VEAYSGSRGISLQELFWNRSVKRVVLLPGATPFDSFHTDRAKIGDDGSLTVAGRPLGGPLLVDTFGSTVLLQGAHLLQAGPTAALWTPERSARPRLRLYAAGRYSDGWLANAGVIYVWPAAPGRPVSGWLSMRLTAQPVIGPARLTFQSRQNRRTSVRVPVGASRQVRIPVCATRDARVTYRSNVRALYGSRPVSVQATAPVFTPSRAACSSVGTS
jgi:hypothetical protein